MKPIYKLILHIVHNWTNELNEAYSEGAIKAFIEQFREEADDLNINISEDQLRKYIERFDTLKNSPKITEKDLSKWSLPKFIKLVTSSSGVEVEEERTPDVVYQDGGVTIWNGNNDENCIRYGRGESWCITRGSWAGHRYDVDKKYPTFYLAKNSNMSDSDKLSFVVIQVRDTGDESERYVIHNRTNSPHYPPPTSFSGILRKAPWLGEIPNLKNILKYQPFTPKEKITNLYKKNPISIRAWLNLPFEEKKQYLVVRGKGMLFSDINNNEFIIKYLPKYQQISNFIAITPDMIDSSLLLKNLDTFSNQDRRSIIANLRAEVPLEQLKLDIFPFDVKKLLVTLDKWKLDKAQRIYISDDGNSIVLLNIGENIQMGLYQEEDDFPNVKLNKRTSKYISQYKDIDKIPFKNLLKLASEEAIDKQVIDKVLSDARTSEDSAIKIKKIGDSEILLDSNSLSSYRIKDGKITKADFNDEDVQKMFMDQKGNEGFQENIIKLIGDAVTSNTDLPATLDKDSLLSIINAIPYNKRKFGSSIIIVPDGEGENNHTLIIKKEKRTLTGPSFGNDTSWNVWKEYYNNVFDKADWRGYFNYLRAINDPYTDEDLLYILKGSSNARAKRAFMESNPPLATNSAYAIAVTPDNYYVVNKLNPRDSYKISPQSNKLVKANIPSSLARQLVGTTTDTTAPASTPPTATATGRTGRGRPAGVPNAPRVTAPAAGNRNIRQAFDERLDSLDGYNALDPRIRRRMSSGNNVPITGNRGASRRDNILTGIGRVGEIIESGGSTIYFISLNNGTRIASIVIQPGNRHFLVTDNNAYMLDSPSQLLQVLRNRNLAEVRQYITREYLYHNPQHTNEVRELLQQHIAETKKA
jgi:hypothetical protein